MHDAGMAFHPHRPHALRPWLRWSIYCLTLALVLSGGMWLVVHFLNWPAASRPALDGLPSPWESPLMKAHGAAMLAMIFFIGRLSGTHVLLGWRIHKRVWDGVAVLVLFGLLAGSGYGLYYWIPDDWRDGLGLIHGAVGCLTVLMLIYHRRR